MSGNAALAEVSMSVVAAHKRHVGKGPSKARTTLCGDVLLTRLNDMLTRAERTAIRLGRAHEVRAMRLVFARAVEAECVRAAEAATGRHVERVTADIHLGTESGLVLFVLAPR